MVPHADSCAFGLLADRVMGYTCAALSYFMLFLAFIVTLPLIGKQDDFHMIQDILLSTTIISVSKLFVFSGLFPNGAGMLDWYSKGLGFRYRGVYFFLWFGIWGAMLVTLGSPLLVYLRRKVGTMPDMLRMQGSE